MVGVLCLLLALGTVKQVKNWTLMVYLDGDCNLEQYAIIDVNEMERGVDTSICNVVVLFDRHPLYDTTNDNWDNTRIYEIWPDDDTLHINSPYLEVGEWNMGDPSSVIDFVTWSIDNYPAEHYALIFWNHGSGWQKKSASSNYKYICIDETNLNDRLYLTKGELDSALDTIIKHLGRPIDILCFDACLMGMYEVEYQLKKYVNYIVHSEYAEPAYGYPYNEILTKLFENPEYTPKEFAKIIAETYVNSYYPDGSQYTGQSATHSAVEISVYHDRLNALLNLFADWLIMAGGKTNLAISNAWMNSQKYDYYGDDSYVDLWDFVNNILQQTGLPSELYNVALQLKDYIDSTVVYSGYYSSPFDEDVSGSHGISIYFPMVMYPDTGQIEADYRDLSFAQSSAWWWFIRGNITLPDTPLLTYYGNSLIEYTEFVSPGTHDFKIVLYNAGGDTARNVFVKIFAPDYDSFISITQDTSSFPDIPSLFIGYPNSNFQLIIDSLTPEGYLGKIYLLAYYDADSLYYVFSLKVDSKAPDIPASWVEPSGWSNDSLFVINWINPEDLSGVDSIYFSFFNPPSNPGDFDTFLPAEPPCTLYWTTEGVNSIYVWLKDKAGNFGDYVMLLIKYDTTNPVISYVTQWNDTSFSGPYPINCEVIEPYLDSVVLWWWTSEEDTWNSILMQYDTSGWYAEIPQVMGDTVEIRYFLEATDSAGNNVTDPPNAPDSCYSFRCTPGFGEKEHLPSSFEIKVYPNPAYKKAIVRMGLTKKTHLIISIYDVSGRRVTRINKVYNTGYHTVEIGKNLPEGVYYMRVITPDNIIVRKLVIMK